jgi:hypothetical protein
LSNFGFIAKCEPNKTDFHTVVKIEPFHTDGNMVFIEHMLFSLFRHKSRYQFVIFTMEKMVLKKLHLVMWKNLIIRRRHWILTLIEIVIPILLFIVVATVRSNIVSSDNETQHYDLFRLNVALKESTEALSTNTLLMYAPNETYTYNVMSLVTHYLHRGKGK